MRSSLLGLNALAIVAFATPALMIFASSGHALAKNPTGAGIALGSMLLGCVSMLLSMLKLGRGRTFPAFAFLLAGVGLVAAPVCVLVLLPYA
jgi:hypothetical protein